MHKLSPKVYESFMMSNPDLYASPDMDHIINVGSFVIT